MARGEVARPFGTSFAGAQAHCPFVVLEPDRFPRSLRVVGPSLRPAGDRWASLRFLLAGPGIRVRVKEYLLDWNPAAGAVNLAEVERAFVAHGTTAWLGRDAAGRRAACCVRWRTHVELAVLAGDLDDDDIAEIFFGLKAAEREAVARLNIEPYARLGWWLAAGRPPVAALPVAPLVCRWLDRDAAERVAPFPLPWPEPLPGGFRLDSLGLVTGPQGGAGTLVGDGQADGSAPPCGADILFRHWGNGSDVLWCRVRAAAQANGTAPPTGPVGDPQVAELPDGTRFAAWNGGGWAYEVRARAGLTLPAPALRRTVRAMAARTGHSEAQ